MTNCTTSYKVIGKTTTASIPQVSLLLFFIITLLLNFTVSAQTPAFPTAEGFGKYVSGGRGGSVIKVTNLNDSGAGSLRAALEASGTRTIIFEVGGTISLDNNIYVNNGNLTIAGQTAPGDGILLKGGMLQVRVSNVIIRYLRFRPGPTAPADSDGLSIKAKDGTTVQNIIIDHCSLSWGIDENFDIRTVGSGVAKNITIQNSIISECDKGALAAKGTYNKTYYRNLFANNSERNIRTNYPDPGTFDFELVNNLIYGFKWATVPSLGSKFTVVNNKYKSSSQVSISASAMVEGESSGQGVVSETYAFISGNIVPAGKSEYNSALIPYIKSAPYLESGVVAISASSLEAEMLDDVGASYPNRDAVDTRLINQYIAGNGALATSGTYPNIQGETAPVDSDNDGMPDYWEIENGLDINNAADRNIVQADGYTNLEYYLNWMILSSTGLSAGIDQNICIDDSAILTATGAASFVWNTGETTASITVSPSVTTSYTVIGTDASGATSTDSVVVTVNAPPIANAGSDAEICEGDEVTLTASGGSTYQWSNGATTQSITVSPASSTSYSVIATQNNCSSTDEVLVTVNPRQTINAGNDVDINLGESTTLTVIGVGNILWSTGETTASITVAPATNTTYTVDVTEQNGCTSTDEVRVTIIGSVNANAGADASICEGEDTILTASGGDDYLWNNGDTTASITVSPTATTNYTVIVSNATTSDTDEVTVFVNTVPNVNAGDDKTINLGEYVTLSATGADTYLWSNGATEPNIAVSPQNTTTYYVTGYTNNCSDESQVTVNVANAVSANAGKDTIICLGDTHTLVASGGESYEWSTGETTQSITVSPTQDTIYEVTVSNQYASGTDDVSVIVENCGGEEEDENSNYQYSVYPNPAAGGVLYIQLSGLSNASSLYIHDTIGKLIYIETITASNGQLIQKNINISNYTSGLYFVTLEEEDRTTTKKIIFQ